MTEIPHDDTLEGLYKLRIRESAKLKTVLELCNVEIHQKKAGLDCLKTMLKRSIDQNLRVKNFEARNGNNERNALVKNQVTKKREQKTLGDCWQWKSQRPVFDRTPLQFPTRFQEACKKHSRILLQALLRGRMREMHREPRVLEARVPVEECFDCRARITSKELAQLHSMENGIHQNACSTSPNMDADLVKSALMRVAR